MNPVILNVATGPYVRGQERLQRTIPAGVDLLCWRDEMPPGSPRHGSVPYAFKAHAILEARLRGYELILWADASILPVASLGPLWAQVERDGYWICRNGWQNAEWTCDAAYVELGITREQNWQIPHVVATAFALDMRHEIGRECADQYLRLAQTRAFCGPWTNKHGEASADPRVLGHRHDQTALSVIAWATGIRLTDAPRIFAYRQTPRHPETILEANGTY